LAILPFVEGESARNSQGIKEKGEHMTPSNEFILIKGVNAVVHSDKCKCTKRSGEHQCVYGYTKEEILEHCYGFKKEKVKFANCADIKLESLNN